MQKWIWKKQNEMEYITLPTWGEMGVTTAFTSRWGGYSQPPYDALNLALHVGDDVETVNANRLQILKAIGADTGSLVCCQQVHGIKIATISSNNAGQGAFDADSAVAGCDAMITRTPGLVLGAFFADCYAIYLFDPVKRVIGLAHSGWKGTLGRISAGTVAEMQRQFGSSPRDIQVFIGPGIGKCCFEIQPDVALLVNQEFPQFDDIMIIDKEHVAWDLAATNIKMLKAMEIKTENISTSNLCTACNTGLFYSYRAEKGVTGRMGAFISLKY